VTNIGDNVFYYCGSLTSVSCQGNAPSSVGTGVFDGSDNATVYYFAGTTGWGTTFAGRPTAPWNPFIKAYEGGFGMRTNQFRVRVTGPTNLVIVVEACTNLANHTWFPLQTNTLGGGSFYFSDPTWTNSPRRFYRIRSP
jgi:hypothetical protein